MSKIYRKIDVNGVSMRVYANEGETGEQLEARLRDEEQRNLAVEAQTKKDLLNSMRRQYNHDYYERNKIKLNKDSNERYRKTKVASAAINQCLSKVQELSDEVQELSKIVQDIANEIAVLKNSLVPAQTTTGNTFKLTTSQDKPAQPAKPEPRRITLAPITSTGGSESTFSPDSLLTSVATPSVDDLLKSLEEI